MFVFIAACEAYRTWIYKLLSEARSSSLGWLVQHPGYVPDVVLKAEIVGASSATEIPNSKSAA
jgi:hypothetical protein